MMRLRPKSRAKERERRRREKGTKKQILKAVRKASFDDVSQYDKFAGIAPGRWSPFLVPSERARRARIVRHGRAKRYLVRFCRGESALGAGFFPQGV